MSTPVDQEQVAVYIRWSTDEQGDGTTLDVQLEACRLFVMSQGWTFRDDLVFIDEGWSGASLERPGLSRLRAAVRRGEVACVVVYKLDRLSRSVLDTVTLVLQEWEGICSLRSTREPVDTTNPTGSILFYMLASYAEWERSTIRERTLAGKIKRAQQGKNPGFTPPYGYRTGEQPGEWLVDAAEAAIVRRVFREYVAGRGTHAIARGLSDDGLRPRKAERFNGLWLARVIRNPIYTGVLRYGLTTLATKAQRLQGAGARIAFAGPRYAAVEGAVPAIVTRAEFERAQQVLAGRNETVGFRNRGQEYLLSGIAVCRCGAGLRGDSRAAGRFYRCGRCGCALMPAERVEAVVWAHLRPTVGVARAWSEEEARRRRQALSVELSAVQGALAKAARARGRAAADYRAGELPARLYAAQVEELEREEQALRAKQSALMRELHVPADGVLQPGVDAWAHLRADERKQVLRHLVARCVVFREPGRGRPVQVEVAVRRVGE